VPQGCRRRGYTGGAKVLQTLLLSLYADFPSQLLTNGPNGVGTTQTGLLSRDRKELLRTMRTRTDPPVVRNTGRPRRPQPQQPISFAPFQFQLSVHNDLSDVESAWRSFEHQADYTPFQAFDWLSAWQRRIGDARGTIPAIVVCRDDNAAVIAILPFTITAGPLRSLTWLGSDLCDYNGPLLAKDFWRLVPPSHFTGFWDAVLKAIRETGRGEFDLVDLRKMPEKIGGQRNPCLELGVIPNASGAYMTTLEPTWDQLYARRSSATRRHDRTKLRRLSAHGEVRFIEPETADNIRTALQTLFQQKEASLARQGIPNLFDTAGYRDFFLDIAINERARKLVHVSQLEVGGKLCAVNFGLVLDGCFYHVLASYDCGEEARYGPGAIHLRMLLRRAIERGLSVFDFTIGDEPYKREWCDSGRILYDHVAAARLRGAPIARLHTFLRHAKRSIKRSPAGWRAFVRMRAARRHYYRWRIARNRTLGRHR
jgi:CelD/BcsL family acetyltransferase involved in cellulose biosynthesis